MIPGLLGIALLTLISEDLTCIGAGLAVARGELGFASAAAACFAGIVAGDSLLFAAGRWAGRTVLCRPALRRWIEPHAVERAAAWLEARGARMVLLSRFMPGLRLPTYVAAGVLGMDPLRFVGLFLLAAALWTPLLVGLALGAAGLGEPWLEQHGSCLIPAAAALALALLGLVRVTLGLATWRGRRLWLGRLRRLCRWEFWPLPVVYAPVVLHVLRLGLSHRCATLFTAANPALPAGGFVGESKSAILAALDGGGGEVARFRVIPAGLQTAARLARALERMGELGLAFPVVVKPDLGERGRLVHVVRDAEQLEHALRAQPGAAILQEYVAGPEYGLYYARPPGAERGAVLGITHKLLPCVIGDGRRTLEELILSDERAVCMARVYFERHVAQLDRVPAAGERIELVPLGSHSRGAIFLDASDLLTPALEGAVDRLSRRLDGFHLGRYDVRARSLAALRAGRFRVLELNGVTSEPTHVYDPRHGPGAAIRALFAHWSLAFEIGAANRASGARVTPARELVRAWRRARAHSGSSGAQATPLMCAPPAARSVLPVR
jgi:membrane protein DedA with SNARE-associated domain